MVDASGWPEETPDETRAYMLAKHAVALQGAARLYRLYLAVRRTNKASVQYMDKPGYVAKSLDCKPKTADEDVSLNGRNYRTAGLVTDPTLVGRLAYTKPGKYEEAVKEWEPFATTLLARDIFQSEGPARFTYLPGGKKYAVQTDPTHEHFGCVICCNTSLISAGRYVHGDFDLFAIVPADNVRQTEFVEDDRWGFMVMDELKKGMKHARAKELGQVQQYVNSRIGRPMILHGDQEKFTDKIAEDEALDVFFPDGRIRCYVGPAQIEELYRVQFEGRHMVRAKESEPTGFGQWRKPKFRWGD